MYRVVTLVTSSEDDGVLSIPILQNLTIEEAREKARDISVLSPTGVQVVVLDWLDDPVTSYYLGLEQPALFGE